MSSSNNAVVYWGTGRRKTSVARVRLVPGNGTITINGRPGDNYLNYNPAYLAAVKAPLQTLGLSTEYDVLVNVRGGGLTGQADAIKQGAARALCELSVDNRKPLKTEGRRGQTLVRLWGIEMPMRSRASITSSADFEPKFLISRRSS